MAYRILVTGSRDWVDETTILEALYSAWVLSGRDRDAILVQGDCPSGADKIAAAIWRHKGLPVESHPADWSIGKRAGPARNKKMVDLGADICLAFPLPHSRGTINCIRLAEEAGIPTRVYKPKE